MQVTLLAAQSIDGFIAPQLLENEPSTRWTSKEETIWFKNESKKIKYLIMGNTTYQTIPDKYRPLKERVNIIMTRSHDASQNLPDTLATDTPIYTSATPKSILEDLSKKGVKSVAICGGKSIYTQFIQQNLITRFLIAIEPVIFGTGVRLSDKPISSKMNFVAIHHLSSQTKVLEYVVTS